MGGKSERGCNDPRNPLFQCVKKRPKKEKDPIQKRKRCAERGKTDEIADLNGSGRRKGWIRKTSVKGTRGYKNQNATVKKLAVCRRPLSGGKKRRTNVRNGEDSKNHPKKSNEETLLHHRGHKQYCGKNEKSQTWTGGKKTGRSKGRKSSQKKKESYLSEETGGFMMVSISIRAAQAQNTRPNTTYYQRGWKEGKLNMDGAKGRESTTKTSEICG